MVDQPPTALMFDLVVPQSLERRLDSMVLTEFLMVPFVSVVVLLDVWRNHHPWRLLAAVDPIFGVAVAR
jgi:hypothetical protein